MDGKISSTCFSPSTAQSYESLQNLNPTRCFRVLDLLLLYLKICIYVGTFTTISFLSHAPSHTYSKLIVDASTTSCCLFQRREPHHRLYPVCLSLVFPHFFLLLRLARDLSRSLNFAPSSGSLTLHVVKIGEEEVLFSWTREKLLFTGCIAVYSWALVAAAVASQRFVRFSRIL